MGFPARFSAFLRVMRRKKRPMDAAQLLRRRPQSRLHEHFDHAQLVELAATIAWEHYRARFNRVFGVRSSGFSEGASCAVPEPAIAAQPARE